MSVDVGGADDFDYSLFGQGPETEADAPEETQSSNAATTAEGEPAQENSEEYPGHFRDILEAIPKEFRGNTLEQLRKMDQNATKMSERIHAQYAPYKQFAENNIQPSDLIQGLQFLDSLNTEPLALLENLKQSLIANGMYTEEAKVQIEQAQQAEIDDQAGNPAPAQDPRLAAIEENQRIILERYQQEETAKQNAAISQQIDREYAELESQIGPMSEVYKAELALRASGMSNMLGRPVTILQAHNDQVRVQRNYRTGLPNASAPRVPSGSGSAGTPGPQSRPLDTVEQRSAAIAEIIARGNTN